MKTSTLILVLTLVLGSAISAPSETPIGIPRQPSSNDPAITKVDPDRLNRRPPKTAPETGHKPSIGIGGANRGLRYGVSLDSDWELSGSVGLGFGRFEVNQTVMTINLKDLSITFLKEVKPEWSFEASKHLSITWSGADGPGRELKMGPLSFDPSGLALPGLQPTGLSSELRLSETPNSLRLNGDFSGLYGDLPGDARIKSFQVPRLNHEMVTHLSNLDGGLNPELTSEVIRVRVAELLQPERLHPRFNSKLLEAGSLSPTESGLPTLEKAGSFTPVRPLPVVPDATPAVRERASASNHVSDADFPWLKVQPPGYGWPQGSHHPLPLSQALLDTFKWTPGLPSANHPHLIASIVEGYWVPAPGYVWVTNEISDLRVRPVKIDSP